ncbi:translation initiation factor IF-2 [Sulfurimonas sp. MAG313]|nr:translation initiation factor IF-2 [Sulfurimonas sp. MAG313]MDF1880704.1 translation initiation factor IF-2 [Sulfurimonas sp. MAG313]
MDKVRVHEIATELGIKSKEVVDKAMEMGIEIKTASSSVSMEDAEKITNYIMNPASFAPEKPKPKIKKAPKKVEETEATDVVTPSAKEEEAKELSDVKVSDETPTETKETEVTQDTSTEEKVEVKEEAKKEEKAPVKPLLNRVTTERKRTGLKIVKKRKPAVVVPATPSYKDPEYTSSYGKMSAEAIAEMESRGGKKKKRSAASAHHSKNQGNRMDIFGGDMADVSMDFQQDQVVLLDFREEEARKEREKAIEEERKLREARNAANANQPRRPNNNNFRNRSVSRGRSKKRRRKEVPDDVIVTSVEIPEDIRVYEFAEQINRPMIEIIKVLFDLGKMATKNDFLGKDEIEILAEEFEVEVTTIDPKAAFDLENAQAAQDVEVDPDAVTRPPVITIMGHVDHGKTSLLDNIRSGRVAGNEAGGITQHIGAYTIVHKERKITFLDTPGHAAFSAIRSRGANVTDIIIIVVAADDGVKPQTLESIKMAKASGNPVIVAVNKMDKDGANADMAMGGMAEHGLSPVAWGGDTEFIPVSAKTGMGVDNLLEAIMLQAEMLELKANPKALAKATVVESSIEKGRGPVATIVMSNGTLRIGDPIVVGSAYGRVKALMNDQKKSIKELLPSETGIVVGLNIVPAAGETLVCMENEKDTKEIAMKRHEYDRHKELSISTKSTMDDLTAMIKEGKLKSLSIILKADVHGSLEALRTSLTELRNDEVKVNIISSGVGGITENDVALANGSDDCMIMGFNVRPTGAVKAAAKQKGVEITTYNVIYNMIDDVTEMLTGMMSPKFTETNTGQADVKEVFKIPKGVVAGCMVVDGKLVRGGLVRVIREGVVIFEGDLTSLKRFKDDVKEISSGYECGVVIEGYNDVIPGDVIETFTKVEQKVQL